MTAVVERSAFERLHHDRRRPGYTIEPLAIAWDAVAFKVEGRRDAIACAPRRTLDDFLDQLDRGDLDEAINAFLAAPPSGRVLRAARQARRPGLFDSMASSGAITPAERVPGRTALGLGGGGGSPLAARQDKGQHRPRRPRLPKRFLVGAAAVGTVVAVGAVAVAVTGGGGNKSVETAGGAPTSSAAGVAFPIPPSPPEPTGAAVSGSDVTGFWSGDWGDLVLRVEGTKVIATYAYDQSEIVGTLSGRRITGWWCEVPTRKGPTDSGPVQFDFIGDPRTSGRIDGRWQYASAGADAQWSEDWDISAKSAEPPPQELVDRLDRVESECHAGQ